MMEKHYSIAKEFTDGPGLRYCSLSDYSGEEFYHSVLNELFFQAYSKDEILTLVLDGSEGYAPSFLDESIGNLVYDFGLKVVSKFLKIVSIEEPEWITVINNETFESWEKRRNKQILPKVTKEHDPWYRLVDGVMVRNKWVTPS